VRNNSETNRLPLAEKKRLGRWFFRIAKVAKADANEAEPLPWIQANTLAQR